MFINNTNLAANSMNQDMLFVVVQLRDDNTYYLTGYDPKEKAASWVTNNAINRFSKNAVAKMITAGLYTRKTAVKYAKLLNCIVISVKDIKRMRGNNGST